MSEEAFKPLRYCTLCKIKVIKEYFLLVLTKADSERKPAFRIHSLKKMQDLPFSSLAVLFDTTNTFQRGGKPATR